MLTLTIQETEFYDEVNNKFIKVPEQTIDIEHSLKSVGKWEQKYHKAFMSDSEKRTLEESIDYIRFMTLTKDVDPIVYKCLNNRLIEEINAYMDDPMSAYKFISRKNSYRYGSITVETVYYWMIVYGIPFSCENWHLNRLLSLIRYCQAKNGKEEKMTPSELARFNTKLNQKRRSMMHTKG